jgi:hypothetical protein
VSRPALAAAAVVAASLAAFNWSGLRSQPEKMEAIGRVYRGWSGVGLQ